MIDDTRYKIAGDFLVSRKGEKQEVKAAKLEFEEGNKLKRGVPKENPEWKVIDLNMWMKK